MHSNSANKQTTLQKHADAQSKPANITTNKLIQMKSYPHLYTPYIYTIYTVCTVHMLTHTHTNTNTNANAHTCAKRTSILKDTTVFSAAALSQSLGLDTPSTTTWLPKPRKPKKAPRPGSAGNKKPPPPSECPILTSFLGMTSIPHSVCFPPPPLNVQ